jgi:hypothetical protein
MTRSSRFIECLEQDEEEIRRGDFDTDEYRQMEIESVDINLSQDRFTQLSTSCQWLSI